MKRIIIILAALLLSISAFAQNGKSIYQKYSDADGVTAVYISPAMFRLIGTIPDLEVGDDKVNISPLIQALTGFYVLSSENPDINCKLRADAERFINTMGNERTINGFAMLAAEAAEVTFISLDGEMPRKEFEALIAKVMNS